MALQSMTGFARSEGTSGRYRWAWELRSVNGKGLDIRLRLPSGMEALEVEARQRLSEALSRGNLQVTLSVTISENRVEAVVNEDALAAVLKLRDALGSSVIDPSPMRLDALLSIRGLVEFREAIDSEEIIAARDAAILDGLSRAVAALGDMRRREGDALGRLLSGHVDRIEELARRVEADPSRSQIGRAHV